MFELSSDYFCGNKASDYAIKNGRLDYGTLAKAFDAVLCNDIMTVTGWENWEQESGWIDYSDEKETLQDQIDEMQDKMNSSDDDDEIEMLQNQIDELQEQLEELEEEEENSRYPEIYQYFIVDDTGADILKDADEYLWYNSDLDLYVWGVDHWGTSWDYVLTNIKINTAND